MHQLAYQNATTPIKPENSIGREPHDFQTENDIREYGVETHTCRKSGCLVTLTFIHVSKLLDYPITQ